MSNFNALRAYNGVHLENLAADLPEAPKNEILLSNLESMRQAARAIAASPVPINHFGGMLLTKVDPVGCVLGRRRERRSYPALIYNRRKISIEVAYPCNGKEIAPKRIRAYQFIPKREVL